MKKLTWKDDLRPVPFLLAFFVAYVLFTIYPIFKGMQMSFFNWTLIEQQEFIGLTHYINVLSDPNFWEAFGNTSLFVLLSTPTMVILALVLALMANLNTRLQTFFSWLLLYSEHFERIGNLVCGDLYASAVYRSCQQSLTGART